MSASILVPASASPRMAVSTPRPRSVRSANSTRWVPSCSTATSRRPSSTPLISAALTASASRSVARCGTPRSTSPRSATAMRSCRASSARRSTTSPRRLASARVTFTASPVVPARVSSSVGRTTSLPARRASALAWSAITGSVLLRRVRPATSSSVIRTITPAVP